MSSGDDRSTRIDGPRSRRRQFLGTLGAAGLVGAAGCIGGDENGDENGDEENGNGENGDENGGENGENGNENGDEPESAFFEVTEPSATDVTQGEEVFVEATIENTGGQEATQEVRLEIDGETVDSDDVTLDGGAETDASLAADTADFEPDDYDFVVASDDDEASDSFTVQAIEVDDPLLSFETDTVMAGTSPVTGTLENPYTLPVEDVQVDLTVPDGWEITADSGTSADSIDSSQPVEWEIEVPDDAEGEHELLADVSYAVGSEEGEFEVSHAVSVFVEESTQFYWSADGYDEGENPQDSWEALEHTDLWEIQTDDDGGQYMAVSGAAPERSYVRFTGPPDAVEVELWATFSAVDDEVGDYWGYVRSPNDDDAANVTQARVDDQMGGGQVRLAEYDSGEFVELEAMEHVAELGEAYHVRAQCTGDTWRARWWLPGEDEPDEWHLETETIADEPGNVGVAHWQGEPFRVYEFAIGTGGENAPTGPLE